MVLLSTDEAAAAIGTERGPRQDPQPGSVIAPDIDQQRQKPTASELVRAVGFFCPAGQPDRWTDPSTAGLRTMCARGTSMPSRHSLQP